MTKDFPSGGFVTGGAHPAFARVLGRADELMAERVKQLDLREIANRATIALANTRPDQRLRETERAIDYFLEFTSKTDQLGKGLTWRKLLWEWRQARADVVAARKLYGLIAQARIVLHAEEVRRQEKLKELMRKPSLWDHQAQVKAYVLGYKQHMDVEKLGTVPETLEFTVIGNPVKPRRRKRVAKRKAKS